MWLSRLGRRRGSLAHLAESAHCLASGPAQVEAGGRSLALHETAAPCNAAGRVNAALVLRQLSSLAAPHSSASSGGSASSSSAGSSSGRGRGSSGSSKHSPSSWQLMARVKQAETCQQVLQLVQQAGQQCDTSHFATAANRMAKLHRQQRADRASHCQAFSQLLQFAAEQRLELRAVAVCQAGYAAGVLRYRFPPAQQAAWQERLACSLADADPQSVANALWGWSKLRARLSRELAAATDAAVQRTAAAMKPQEVSNTLWAFANGSWQLSNDASAALRQRLEAVLPKTNAQEVANSLWALAKLGLPLEGADAAAVDAAVQRTAAAMGPQEVSNTLWAFATGGWQLSSSAAAALMLQLEAVLPDASSQAVANSLWALATLTVTHGNRFATVPAPLLDAVVAWADAHWHQLPATWVCDLCYNLARLGVQPDRAWINAAVARCVAGISARESENGWFANLIWACSKWQHSLDAAALAPLVAGAVSSVSADWQRKGRRGGLRLLRSLAQQPGGFSMASAPASAAEALQQRLLPLVCGDIDLVASLEAEGGELDYLADCAASCAAVGLHLPPAQLEAICRYVQDNPQQLDDGVRAHLQRAFEAWGHQPGRALLAQLSVAV